MSYRSPDPAQSVVSFVILFWVLLINACSEFLSPLMASWLGNHFNPCPGDFLNASFRNSRVDLQSHAQRKWRNGPYAFSIASGQLPTGCNSPVRADLFLGHQLLLEASASPSRFQIPRDSQAAILTNNGRKHSDNEFGKRVLKRSACWGWEQAGQGRRIM